MKVVQKEKFRALAEANGWPLDHAKGYVDGETHRLRGKRPSNYVLIGLDDYCLGFRAGYYERQSRASTASLPDLPAASR